MDISILFLVNDNSPIWLWGVQLFFELLNQVLLFHKPGGSVELSSAPMAAVAALLRH
jgi:hypothetical protein